MRQTQLWLHNAFLRHMFAKLNYIFGKPDRLWQMAVDRVSVQRSREEPAVIKRHRCP